MISVRFDERNGKGRRENGRGMHQQNCDVGKTNDNKSTAYSKNHRLVIGEQVAQQPRLSPRDRATPRVS